MTEAKNGPLEGLRIIDLTRLAPGPYATMLLGDLGASVITVEPPPSRLVDSSPGAIPVYGTEMSRNAALNPLFRSRRSIVIDLKKPEGRDLLVQMIRDADVFIEGFRPGVVDRLGIDYETLREVQPTLIYCSVSGYGQEDPRRDRPGHDLTYLAESGLLSATSRDNNRPGIPLNVAGDLAAGGLVAAFGILAAVRGRDQTGVGSFIDVSIYQGLLSLVAPTAAWERAGAGSQSWGQGMLSGLAPFYDCYATSDGRWIAIAANEPKFYKNMCVALRLDGFDDAQADVARWPRLRAALEAVFMSRDLAEWMLFLEDSDFPFAPVRSIDEAFGAELEGPDAGAGLPPVFVPKFSEWAQRDSPVVHTPGQNSLEILSELGLRVDEITELLRGGVIFAPADESPSGEE